MATSTSSAAIIKNSKSFTVLLFSYYVGIGSLQLLCTKASEAPSRDGSLAYNTAFVVCLIELVKLLLAFFFSIVLDRAPGTTVFSLFQLGGLRYGLPAFFYALQNNMNILAIPLLHPHVFQLFNNLKIVSAALFSSLILGKQYQRQQWCGMLLLVLACCVSKWQTCLSALELVLEAVAEAGPPGSEAAAAPEAEAARPRAADEDPLRAASKSFLLGLTLALLSVATSGLAGVVNEYVLKVGARERKFLPVDRDEKNGFWRKNQFTYGWGVLFNLVAVLLTAVQEQVGDDPESSIGARVVEYFRWSNLFRNFTPIVVALIAVNVGLGVSISLVFRYFDNVAKSFGGPMILFTTTFFTWLLFDSEITGSFLLALILYVASVLVYVSGGRADIWGALVGALGWSAGVGVVGSGKKTTATGAAGVKRGKSGGRETKKSK
eukprot:g17920.t1